MRRCALFVALASALAGCGDDAPSGRADAGPDTETDGGNTADGSVDASPAVTLLVPINADGQHSLALLALHESGAIRDSGVRVPAPGLIRSVSFGADGREALATYGIGPEAAKGMLVVELEPDGSAASVADELVLETANSPATVLHTGDGQGVIGMGGPDEDYLLTVSRGDGGWATGASVPSGEGPIELYDLGQPGRALLLLLDVIGDGGNHALPIAQGDDGGWAVAGDGVDFGDEFIIELAVAPSGDRAYLPVSDPEADPDDINPSGLLMTIEADADTGSWSASAEAPVPLEDSAAQIAIAREGDVMALNDPVAYRDPLMMFPQLSHYELQTVAVTDTGAPFQVPGTRTRVESSFVDDLAFGPARTLVVALTTEEGEVVRSYQRAAAGSSVWVETGSVTLEGSPSGVYVGPEVARR